MPIKKPPIGFKEQSPSSQIPLRANILASERFYRGKGIKVLDGNKYRLCLDIPGN